MAQQVGFNGQNGQVPALPAGNAQNGQPAMVDPEIIKAIMKRKADRLIEEKVPNAIRTGSQAIIQGSVAGVGAVAKSSSHAMGLNSDQGVDLSTQASANASIQTSDPTVTACANRTADVSKSIVHKGIDVSVDSTTSFWN